MDPSRRQRRRWSHGNPRCWLGHSRIAQISGNIHLQRQFGSHFGRCGGGFNAVGTFEDREIDGLWVFGENERVVDAVLVGIDDGSRLGRSFFVFVLRFELAETFNHVLHGL